MSVLCYNQKSGLIALFAAYSYVKLGVYYKDEGATYTFSSYVMSGFDFTENEIIRKLFAITITIIIILFVMAKRIYLLV